MMNFDEIYSVNYIDIDKKDFYEIISKRKDNSKNLLIYLQPSLEHPELICEGICNDIHATYELIDKQPIYYLRINN